MLPTFPFIERVSAKATAEAVRALAARHAPILGQIKAHIQHEGGAGAINRADGSVGDVTIRPIGAKVELPTATSIYDFTTDKVMELIEDIAQQFAQGQSRMLFEEMDKVTTETGNVIDGGGKPFNVDLFLQMIEKMEHRFDAHGNWQAPTVVGSQKMLEAVAALSDVERADVETRLATVLEQKKREFLDREARRILAG